MNKNLFIINNEEIINIPKLIREKGRNNLNIILDEF